MKSKNKILIIGGGGYVGSMLVPYLMVRVKVYLHPIVLYKIIICP